MFFTFINFFFFFRNCSSIYKSYCHGEYWIVSIRIIKTHCSHKRVHVVPAVQCDAPSFSTQIFKKAAHPAPFANSTGSYALPPVAVEDVQKIQPIHVHVGLGEQDGIFSNIVFFGAFTAPTVAHPLTIAIQFTKIGELTKPFF